MKLVNLVTLVLLMVSASSMAQRPQSQQAVGIITNTVLSSQSAAASHDRAVVGGYLYAAQQGNALAQFKLGQLYLDGDLLEQDHRKALSWFTASAEQGLIQAQLLLSSMYLKGMGTTKDLQMARKWFDIAMSSSERTQGQQLYDMQNTMVF